MRRIVSIITGVLFFLATGIASAQGVQYAEKTEYSFDDDVVTGDLVRPDGELTIVRKKGKERSLIKVREHFIQEMLKSVENL
jgi:phosphoserine phosphatase